MRPFRDISIRYKVIAVTVATSFTVLLTAMVVFLFADLATTRATMVESNSTLARVLGVNSTAAIAFGDAETGEEILSALAGEPSVISATLFDTEGEPFARYLSSSAHHQGLLEEFALAPPGLSAEGVDASYMPRFAQQYLEVKQPIRLNQRALGTIRIRIDLSDLRESIVRQLLIALMIMLATVATAYFLASWMQSLISRPVLRLADLMRAVSRYGDYSLRANKESEDEVGTLMDGFNAMVEQIQYRDRKLESVLAKLSAAKDDAEAANNAKSTFLANMSHEIRTPLNAIVGLTALLWREDPTPRQLERLNSIETSAGHLLSIINDILDLSKIEAGKITLERSDFHLDEVFDQIQSLLKEPARRKGLTIKVLRNGVPMWLRGDLTRVRQALLNYASNAIKFTEQGSISLRARLLEENGNELLVRFEVRDTGIGIDADTLPDLFEAFSQADATTTRKYGGTGLGLTITRLLVEMMGGEVGAESVPGRGSTFWFTVRLNRGKGIAPELPAAAENDAEMELRHTHRGKSILLVEDNLINSEVACELLSSVGLVVSTAENGREALTALRSGDYDLILMDVQMPKMDGLEATRAIRAMAGMAKLPILAMTANIFDEDRRACMEAGMNDFVAKPVDPKNLFKTIAKWLSKRAALGGATPGKSHEPRALETAPTRAAAAHPQSPIDEPAAATQVAPLLVDPEALTRLFGNDSAKKQSILKNFATNAAQSVTELTVAGEARDAEMVSFLAHRLKSSARTVGAGALADLCLNLEMAGKNAHWPTIDKDCGELQQVMSRVSICIDSMCLERKCE